jgi:hypothetical protein
LSYESLKSGKRRIFFANKLHTRAVEVTKRGREKVKKRKEKKKSKEGEKVAPAKARFRVP